MIENKNVEYPNKEYSVNISNSQNINNQGHLWKGNYNYNFSINLKDFNNYSFDYFSFKIEFELLEQIIDKNDIAITNKNQIQLDYDFKMTAKTIINEQSIQELNSNEVIKYQSLVTARLDKTDDYIFSVELFNSKAQDKTLMNKKYFKKRSVSINKIKISIIPKINYDIFKDETIALEYDLTRTGIQLEEINKIVNEQLVQIIDIKGINSNIFFYLFDGINFLQEDISDLSLINPNLEYKMNVSCAKSYVINNDAFLKNMLTPSIKIKFVQKFKLNNLGLKTNIYTSDLSLVDKRYIINWFNGYSFLFNTILDLKKDNETQ